MTTSYLDSERHFRRYEEYIRQIVNNWPQCTVFTPRHPVGSAETLSSRIRICIKSLKTHDWPIKWNLSAFIQCCDEIIVSTAAQPGKVVCGPYDLIRKQVPLDTKVESELSIPAAINLDDPSEDVIQAIMILHHNQILLQPTTIRTDYILMDYKKIYDVEITQDKDIYTIL